MKNLPNSQKGQSLIDVLIATFIFAILVTAIVYILTNAYSTLIFSKNQLSAKYIATEKMEYLLNLSYDNLGTTTGIPNGVIPEYQQEERNGQIYDIHTTISYYDDPFDQLAPNDLLPTDYKQIRVSVNYQDSNTEPIVLVSNVSPMGIETSKGGGTLSILVIDSQAQPVPQAQIHIINSDVSPNIDITLQTNIDGRVILPGAPPCPTCYHLEISKEDFTEDKTYTTDDLANPDQKPITVTEARVSEAVFVIDKVSQIKIISTQNLENFPIYPNATFRLTGSKTIGTNQDGDPVYKFDQVFTTGGNGEYIIENGEWDNYTLTIPEDQNQDLAAITPSIPIVINPDENIEIKYAINNQTNNSLLMSVKDASGSAIASASAILNFEPNFNEQKFTGKEGDPNWGQVFFEDLLAEIYEFTVSHSDYATSSGTISIDGNIIDQLILNKDE